MKDSKHIISTITKNFGLKKLSQSHELEKIKVFLPKNFKENLLFISMKNQQILFAFKNPIICNEFNKYLIKNISDSIQEYQDFFPSLPKQFNIKGYVPLNLLKEFKAPAQITLQIYQETALGNFYNHCKDKKLHEGFEKIRNKIIQLQSIKS